MTISGSLTHRSRVNEANSYLVFLQITRQGGACAIGRCFAHPIPVQAATRPAVPYRAHLAGDDHHLQHFGV